MNLRHCLLFGALFALNAAAESIPASTLPMPGSYQAAEVDQQVREVARFAVREQRQQAGGQLKLLKVLACERQVVAGLNYRLRLEVRRAGERAIANALVFTALDGSRTLVSWQWEGVAP